VRYILDTGAIVRRPEILARRVSGGLLVPQTVVEEIRRRVSRGVRADLPALLDRAIEAGTVVVPSSSRGTAELALACAGESDTANVRVITTDRRLIRLLATQDVTSMSSDEFPSEQEAIRVDADIERLARRIVSDQWRHLAVGFLIAAVATAVAIVTVLNHQLIFHRTPPWLIPPLLLLLATLFFWWRGRHRFSYGLFEISIGLLIASQSVVVLPATYELSTAKSLQFIGGLYIMVRGFDSLDLSIENTSLGSWWRRLFHGGR
jgi:rRNA-processing protein FCF1